MEGKDYLVLPHLHLGRLRRIRYRWHAESALSKQLEHRKIYPPRLRRWHAEHRGLHVQRIFCKESFRR